MCVFVEQWRIWRCFQQLAGCVLIWIKSRYWCLKMLLQCRQNLIILLIWNICWLHHTPYCKGRGEIQARQKKSAQISKMPAKKKAISAKQSNVQYFPKTLRDTFFLLPFIYIHSGWPKRLRFRLRLRLKGWGLRRWWNCTFFGGITVQRRFKYFPLSISLCPSAV